MNPLLWSLLLAAFGIVLLLILRRPLRRLLGAGPVFGLWALPLLLAAMPWLPAWPAALAPGVDGPGTAIGAAVHVVAERVAVASDWSWRVAWLIGVVVMLTRLAWHVAGIVRRAAPMPAALQQELATSLAPFAQRSIRLHPAGPAVSWLPGHHLLLPADFAARFDAAERAQVLRHEAMHLRRGDPWWSLAAELMLAALWFFPVAWWAMPRFRLDLELACDAAVVRGAPRDAGSYAHALLAAADVTSAAGPVTAWLSRSQLKERLMNLQPQSRAIFSRRFAWPLVAAVLAAVALTAQAALPAPGGAQDGVAATSGATRPATLDKDIHDRIPPQYPPSAIRAREQGTVILMVYVDPHGNPAQVKVDELATDAPASLQQAAIDAVWKWRYNVALAHGQPVGGWVRVPVSFTLNEY